MISLQQITADIKGKSFTQTFSLDLNYRTLFRMITHTSIRHESDRLNLVDSQIVQFCTVCNFTAVDVLGRKTSAYHLNVFTTFLYAGYLAKQIIQCGLFGKNRIRYISCNSFLIQLEGFPICCYLHTFKLVL